MQIIATALRDVKLVCPRRFVDERGWFAETFNRESFAAAGLPVQFAQDNHSSSIRGVLRGLHYQLGKPQGKLVRCVSGHIWDVVVDLRRNSPDFGKWAAFDLTPLTPGSSDQAQIELLWIPQGFAHGFLVLSQTAEVLYKATDLYHSADERCILWNDPTLNILWPIAKLDGAPISVSPKDALGKTFLDADLPPVG